MAVCGIYLGYMVRFMMLMGIMLVMVEGMRMVMKVMIGIDEED